VDLAEFNKKYWFRNTAMVEVTNPRDEDFEFTATIDTGQIDFNTGKSQVLTRKYLVKAGGSEKFVGSIANLYLDQMSKLVAQDRDEFGLLVDFAVRARYYDEMIANVNDLMAAYEPDSRFASGSVPGETPSAGNDAAIVDQGASNAGPAEAQGGEGSPFAGVNNDNPPATPKTPKKA
jgi:hypothetical protein